MELPDYNSVEDILEDVRAMRPRGGSAFGYCAAMAFKLIASDKSIAELDKLFVENDSRFSTLVSYEVFMKCTLSSGLEGQDLEKFLEGLIIFSQDMSVELRILAMYDPTGKLELIQSSLEIYMDSFMEEQEKTERLNSKRMTLAEGKSLLGYSQLQYSLYASLAFILVLVIVLVFKVELNLRKIAPAINNRDLE